MESNYISKGDIYNYTLENGEKYTYEVLRFKDDKIVFTVNDSFHDELTDHQLDLLIKMGAMKLIKKG